DASKLDSTFILPPRKRTDRLEDPPQRSRHSHKGIWTLAVVLAGVIIAAGLYGRSALAAYKGRLDQLPGLQAAISLAGNRIETLENAYRTWSSQQDSWALQLKQMEAKFDGGMRTVRKQAEEIVARAQARMQDDLDRRTAALQARVDKLQSAQNTADARLT